MFYGDLSNRSPPLSKTCFSGVVCRLPPTPSPLPIPSPDYRLNGSGPGLRAGPETSSRPSTGSLSLLREGLLYKSARFVLGDLFFLLSVLPRPCSSSRFFFSWCPSELIPLVFSFVYYKRKKRSKSVSIVYTLSRNMKITYLQMQLKSMEMLPYAHKGYHTVLKIMNSTQLHHHDQSYWTERCKIIRSQSKSRNIKSLHSQQQPETHKSRPVCWISVVHLFSHAYFCSQVGHFNMGLYGDCWSQALVVTHGTELSSIWTWFVVYYLC